MANVIFRNGYFRTGIKAIDSSDLKLAFASFLERDNVYRERFLQKLFVKGIDGYSYLGQKDSLNQYAEDLLHSFVLSKFNDLDLFPVEFHGVLISFWDKYLSVVNKVEEKLIDLIDDEKVRTFYVEHLGHMISANYYPSLESETSTLRLSEHVDVSLLTIFPFGVDGDLKFLVGNTWVETEVTDEIIVFPGYLLERLTSGRIKAVTHKVDFPQERKGDRFSFAFFSIPHPGRQFILEGNTMTSEDYMAEYLSLF